MFLSPSAMDQALNAVGAKNGNEKLSNEDFLTTLGEFNNKASGVEANNAFNAAEAEKQRVWEKEMSDTQYQRTVADMREAGINPASIMSGGLSTIGSGSAASSSGNSNILSTLLNVIGKVAGKSQTTINKIFAK